MLFWFILGTIFMVSGLRVRDMNWFYSEELAGILLPAAFASFMMPGWMLLQFEEPGFQALGLLLAGCSAWMWVAAVLISLATLVECVKDAIDDLREEE